MKKILFFIMSIVFTGCQIAPAETSIFDKPICPPPCWETLTPGKSTKEEALLVLDSLAEIDNNKIISYSNRLTFPEGSSQRVYDETINAPFTSEGQNEAFLNMYILAGKVSVISFELYSNHITLSYAINKFGEPEYVVITPYGGNNLVVGLVAPSRGIAFVYSTVGRSNKLLFEIHPDIGLSSIYFFDVDTYDQFLESRSLTLGERDKDATNDSLLMWEGYGRIDEIYTDDNP